MSIVLHKIASCAFPAGPAKLHVSAFSSRLRLGLGSVVCPSRSGPKLEQSLAVNLRNPYIMQIGYRLIIMAY